MSLAEKRPRIKFGVFELDPNTGELTKHGTRVRLQEQPFQVLLTLLERPGELITRDEMRERLWPGDIHVEFDQSLHRAVNKVREALGDVSDNPRFIETLPKRGYRFIAPVNGSGPQTVPEIQLPPAVPAPTPKRLGRKATGVLAALIVAAALIVCTAAWIFIMARPPHLRAVHFAVDSEDIRYPLLSDGSRVYFVSDRFGPDRLMQVSAGGTPSALPYPLPGPKAELRDISPDGQDLLMIVDTQDFRFGMGQLWEVRVSDGRSLRLGPEAVSSAKYSPDARRIAWTTGGKLFVLTPGGSKEIASTPCNSLVAHSWPSAGEIELVCYRGAAGPTIWRIDPDGSGLRRVLPQWDELHYFAAPTPDGQSQLWLGRQWHYLPASPWVRKLWGGVPKQITFGAPQGAMPSLSRDGRVLLLAKTRLGELQRFDRNSRAWQRHLGGISGDLVEYSPDRQWIVYVGYPQGQLWRCRADGTQCALLSGSDKRAVLPRWSPDGKIVSFVNRASSPWRIWLVSPDGTNLRLATRAATGHEIDPAWTADGRKIIFSGFARYDKDSTYLRIVDLETGQETKMAGTDGFCCPKSTVDGTRLLAQVSTPPRGWTVSIIDPATGKWKTAIDEHTEFPSWAPDGKSVLYSTRTAIRRFRIDTGTAETITTIDRYHDIYGSVGGWVGRDATGAPLVMRNRGVNHIYRIEVGSK